MSLVNRELEISRGKARPRRIIIMELGAAFELFDDYLMAGVRF